MVSLFQHCQGSTSRPALAHWWLPAAPLPHHAGKVVDRHWYSKNKHIYPASRWAPFDEAKQYPKNAEKPH